MGSDQRKEYLKQWRKKNKKYLKQQREKNKEHLSKYQKKYYQEHKQRILKRNTKYNKAHKEYIKEYRKQYGEKNKKHIKECQRLADIRRKYGLSKEEYYTLLLKQDHKCAICLMPLENEPHVDHDHKTGKVRNLLCSSCNAMLGLGGDNPDILLNGSKYLRRWEG
jgi:hypothetical protein